MFLGWLAAAVAMLTGLAMLSDTHLSRGTRQHARAFLWQAARAVARGDRHLVDRSELAAIVRFSLRTSALVLIVASSGVTVLLPLGAGLQASPYEVLLRCGLAAFMAMQVPCPWIRWITSGQQSNAAQGGRHAQ